MQKQAAPKGLLRLLHLLRGGDTAALMRQGQAAHIASLMPGSPVTPEMVDAAYAPYRAEVGKVVGTYLGAGAVAAGLGYAGKHIHADAHKPRMSRALEALGIKVT